MLTVTDWFSGVMFSIFVLSVLDIAFQSMVKLKTINLVFVASVLSTQYNGKDWFIGNQDNMSELRNIPTCVWTVVSVS